MGWLAEKQGSVLPEANNADSISKGKERGLTGRREKKAEKGRGSV